jgi:hypothetical protein
MATNPVLTLADIHFDDAASLLGSFDLSLVQVADGEQIPGSYWGECEAGVIGSTVHARSDTPVHSLLHEGCHLIVLSPDRRAGVHTDATDSIEEEDAVCVLGYTFRRGSARAYVEHDAEAAWTWLEARGLVNANRLLIIPPR